MLNFDLPMASTEYQSLRDVPNWHRLRFVTPFFGIRALPPARNSRREGRYRIWRVSTHRRSTWFFHCGLPTNFQQVLLLSWLWDNNLADGECWSVCCNSLPISWLESRHGQENAPCLGWQGLSLKVWLLNKEFLSESHLRTTLLLHEKMVQWCCFEWPNMSWYKSTSEIWSSVNR